MIRKVVKMIASDPLRVPSYFWSKLHTLWLSTKSNVNVEGKLRLNGKPLIDIQEGSFLFIGKRVTLNSRNRGYHINMHSPVKLFADRQGAEIRIGDDTRIHGSCLHSYQSIVVGKNCLIAANCQIFDGNGHDLSFPLVENRINTKGISKPIIIEDNVWIGANSIILPGVTIGQGSVISANSVVTKDIPKMSVAGGNPAIIIRHYQSIEDRAD